MGAPLEKAAHDALAFFQRAVELNPNECPMGYGLALAYAQRGKRQWRKLSARCALILSIRRLYSAILATLGTCWGRSKPQSRHCEPVSGAPNFRPAFVFLAAASAQAGRIDEARAAAAEVMRIDPGFSLSTRLARAPYIDRKRR